MLGRYCSWNSSLFCCCPLCFICRFGLFRRCLFGWGFLRTFLNYFVWIAILGLSLDGHIKNHRRLRGFGRFIFGRSRRRLLRLLALKLLCLLVGTLSGRSGLSPLATMVSPCRIFHPLCPLRWSRISTLPLAFGWLIWRTCLWWRNRLLLCGIRQGFSRNIGLLLGLFCCPSQEQTQGNLCSSFSHWLLGTLRKFCQLRWWRVLLNILRDLLSWGNRFYLCLVCWIFDRDLLRIEWKTNFGRDLLLSTFPVWVHRARRG